LERWLTRTKARRVATIERIALGITVEIARALKSNRIGRQEPP
jgi:hypothetical protein